MNKLRTRAIWVGVVVLASAIVAAPAVARPASSFYTPDALQAMSANWAAKGRLIGSRDATTFYTREQLDALSTNWAAKGRLVGNPNAASFYTSEQLQALGRSWAAKGSLFGVSPAPPPATGSGGFDWSDFGIGAGAMLGLVLLLAGLGAAAHYGRRGGIRARPIS